MTLAGWCGCPQALHMPCLNVVCMFTGTDGAGRGKIFLLILLRNDKLRCDYRTVKKELPERNFQMVMQNYYWRVNSKVIYPSTGLSSLCFRLESPILSSSPCNNFLFSPVTTTFLPASSIILSNADNNLLNLTPQEYKMMGSVSSLLWKTTLRLFWLVQSLFDWV